MRLRILLLAAVCCLLFAPVSAAQDVKTDVQAQPDVVAQVDVQAVPDVQLDAQPEVVPDVVAEVVPDVGSSEPDAATHDLVTSQDATAPKIDSTQVAPDTIDNDKPAGSGGCSSSPTAALPWDGESDIPQIIDAVKSVVSTSKTEGTMAIISAVLFLLLLIFKFPWLRAKAPATVRRLIPLIAVCIGVAYMVMTQAGNGWFLALLGAFSGGGAIALHEVIIGTFFGKRGKTEARPE